MSVPRDWSALVDAAWRAREHAYAPYSKYRVGAGILTEDGRVFVGCNVENASYGLCLCAERSAMSAAIVAGARRFVAVAVVTGGAQPGTPCGMCRQVLSELASDARVRCVSESGAVLDTTVADLLPHAFTPAALGVETERSTMVLGTTDERFDTDRPPPPRGDSVIPKPSTPFVGVALKVAAGTGAELADVTHIEGDDERGRS